VNSSEYEKLNNIDVNHWFYRGKRAIVRHWIERFRPLGANDLLVDAGMGTGTWLIEMAGNCKVLGLDDHDESLALAIPRLQKVNGAWCKTSLNHIDLKDNVAAVTTALDVLEHIQDDNSAIRELIRITQPGGLIVITVPALKFLWSDWDVTLHHYRRYERSELRKLAAYPSVDLLRLSFFNTATLPLIYLVRMFRKIRQPKPGKARMEDAVPPSLINSILYQSMVFPAKQSWIHPPMGVSLLAILRKR
jgi:ubiquinone/menaquinone biosynthesis C-methylase UbiE